MPASAKGSGKTSAKNAMKANFHIIPDDRWICVLKTSHWIASDRWSLFDVIARKRKSILKAAVTKSLSISIKGSVPFAVPRFDF